MKSRFLATLPLVLLLAASGCATIPNATTPGVKELRLPGLPWGATTPEVTAALVERGFRFAGRNAVGDLRFDDGELLGHDASLVARMYRDRLVKVVAYLEPGDPGRMGREVDAIAETLQRFYGAPSIEGDGDDGDPRPASVGEASDHHAGKLAWLERRPDGLLFGVMVRATPRPAYRLDFESPIWPEVYTDRRRDGTLQNAVSLSFET